MPLFSARECSKCSEFGISCFQPPSISEKKGQIIVKNVGVLPTTGHIKSCYAVRGERTTAQVAEEIHKYVRDIF